MTTRICGGHCPTDNLNPATTKNCRICSKQFHLPCYDVIATPSKLFVSNNIVFICDACLDAIDNESSPKRKKNVSLRQSLLSPNVNGNVGLGSQQPPQQPNASVKGTNKQTNEQLISMMSKMMKKMDEQTNKLDEIGQKVCSVGNEVIATKNKSNDVYNIVHSRLMLREQQNMRDLAKQMFQPNSNLNQTNAPKTPTGETPIFGGKTRTYSSIIQSKLSVTPQPENPSQRKRESHISLVNNATKTTVQSVKLPTPKQGKKDIQIGRPVVERQIVPRNVNPFTKAIWISKFNPETAPEELENYITEQTEVKDKTKFKCSKLVKKDADITQMSYVSFKIDVTPEVFDILINAENWPSNKHVREFVRMSPPKPTIADFMPAKPTPASNANELEKENEDVMNIANELLNNDNSSGSNVGNGNGSTSTATKNQ